MTTRTTFDGHLDEAIYTMLDTQAMIDEDNAPMIEGCIDQLNDLDDKMICEIEDDDYDGMMIYTIVHNAICTVFGIAKGYAKGKIDVRTAENVCITQRFILVTAQRMLRK